MSIEQWTPRAEVAIASAQDTAVQRLGEWAQSANAAHEVAQTLVQTSFCPEQFRNKPGEATAAILAGMEVGLQPMAALRSFDIIQGTAAPRAITLRAIVQSRGHEMEVVESTEARCKMRGRRKGSADWQTVTWTVDRARQLGVTNKPNWKNQPQTMLVARATSELARLIASDAILGLPYSAEEIADGGGQEVAEPVTSGAPAGTRRMSRPRPVAAVPDAPDDGPSYDEPPVAPPTDADIEQAGARVLLLNTSSALAKKMFATLGDAGIAEKEARLAYVSDVVGRTITTSGELTEAEASQVIDALEADLAEPFPTDDDARRDLP